MNSVNKILFLVFILTVFSVFAQNRIPDSKQLKELNTIIKFQDSTWAIGWDKHTGAPSIMRGNGIDLGKNTKLSPVELINNFFVEKKNLFGLKTETSKLVLKKEKNNRGIIHLSYQQFYKNIPVFDYGYKLTVDGKNKLTFLQGKIDPEIDIANITPTIDSFNATLLASKEIGISSDKPENGKSEQIIYASEGNYYLGWKITFQVYDPLGDWLIIVDANDGKIHYKENRVTGVTGTGDAYTSHPLNGNPVSKSLYHLGTTGFLNGTYVQTNNEDGPEAYNAGYSYVYSTSNQNFDEVNVYYHVTEMQYNFFKALDPGYNPIQRYATVHYLTNHNNAHAGPSGVLYFGDGDNISYHDFAKEESCIYHENAHVVIFEANDMGIGDYSQAGAMHEGYSDYFAATFSTQPTDYKIGEWVDMSGEIRNLENNATWNGSWTQGLDKYDYANVWGGTLWDCKQTISKSVVDWLAYDGLYDLQSTATFDQALTAIINSDENTYGGSHVSTLRSVFNTRGIYESVSAYMSGPPDLGLMEWGTYTMNPSGGNGSYTYQWQYRLAGSGTWTSIGTTQSISKKMVGSDFELQCTATSIYGLSTTAYKYVQFSEAKMQTNYRKSSLPEEFSIKHNYPNPFNPSTTIEYALPTDEHVTIKVFDILGREITTLVNDVKHAGEYSVNFDASHLASGIYFYTITAGKFNKTNKMILTK